MTVLRRWISVPVAVSAGLLAGCAASPVAMMGGDHPVTAKSVARESRPAADPAGRPVRVAALMLSDDALGQLRGGYDLSPGVIVNFGFQQATYVNNSLIQSVVVPTLTIAGNVVTYGGPMVITTPNGSATFGTQGVKPAFTSFGGMPGNGQSTILINGVAQSSANGGLTQVITAIGGGSLTSVIKNQVNGQKIQQFTSMNIGITGLSHMLQQTASDVVMNRAFFGNLQPH